VILQHSTRTVADDSEPETNGLSVGLTFEGSRGELWLAGRLDAYSVVALRAQVDQLRLVPCRDLVVHVEHLEDLDADGLSTLSSLRAVADEHGARFRIEGMRGPIPSCLRDERAGEGQGERHR
jgi:hypothetical protein